MNIRRSKKSEVNKPLYGNMYLKVLSRIINLVLVLVVIYPMLFILMTSFKDNEEFYTNVWGLPQIWRWSNYTYAWISAHIGGYALNSLIVTVSAVMFSVILSALAGYALSKMYIPKANMIISILMALNFIPGVAVYISLYSQMISMGLNRTLWILILPYMAWQIPFSVYILKQFFDSLPAELLEAARVDGSGEIHTFAKIVLPLVKPAIATVTVFNFVTIWGEYMWASISSSATMSIATLPVGLLYFRGEYGIEWGPFAAAIMIIVIPMIIIFTYFQKYFVQGITAGAVKG